MIEQSAEQITTNLEKLKELIASSTKVKAVVTTTAEDFTKSFNR